MTIVERLGAFASRARFEDLTAEARAALPVVLADSIGCAIGAQDGPPVRAIRALLEDLGGRPTATLIGGGRTSPDRAALYNGALVRYLDFNDSYLAPAETCHPSDCLGAVLAAAEHGGASGADLAAAIAVSYQVQCRLSDEAPVRARGFDHTTHLAYAAAAGAARALGLAAASAANAIAIAGTAHVALRVTRTGELSNWKGLAAPAAAHWGLQAALLAQRGISGPREVFEGNKGFMESVSGAFEIAWDAEPLDRVARVALKRYNAEVHSQSALEAVIELRRAHELKPDDVERVELEVFDVAWNIIGGGEEGDKRRVATKEEADHSLPYMVAVALCDGEVTPVQYAPDRIAARDVQSLLQRVAVRPAADLSQRFPAEHACRVAVHLRDGRVLRTSKRDYEGYPTRPMSAPTATAKLRLLASPYADARLLDEIVSAVFSIDAIRAGELTALLAAVRRPQQEEAA